MDKTRRCKACKQTYADHLEFVLDEWEGEGSKMYDPDKVVRCNRFKPMTNLELLEWEDERRNP
jgi:hypothetical protein